MTIRSSDAAEIARAEQWLREHGGKPLRPEWVNATSMEEAFSALSRHGREARIFAGGTDLIPLMKNGVLTPGVLVNIKPIRALRHITLGREHLTLGASSRLRDLERSGVVRGHYPLLHEAVRSIASPNVRNMGTVAGNLCQDTRCWYYRRSDETGISFNCRRKGGADHCYALHGENQYHAVTGPRQCVSVCPSDLATVLLAMDGEIKTADGRGGRAIPLGRFFTEFGNTLHDGEIISSVRVPRMGQGVRQKFIKFRARKTIDFAVVSVATSIATTENGSVEKARIVLGGISSTPKRSLDAEDLLLGQRLTRVLAEEAARACLGGLIALSGNGYKLPIIRALVKRALLETVEID